MPTRDWMQRPVANFNLAYKIHHGFAPTFGVVPQIDFVICTQTRHEIEYPPEIRRAVIGGDGEFRVFGQYMLTRSC